MVTSCYGFPSEGDIFSLKLRCHHSYHQKDGHLNYIARITNFFFKLIFEHLVYLIDGSEVQARFIPFQPHSVVPSPGNGFQINCNVGETCDIPVYIHEVSG